MNKNEIVGHIIKMLPKKILIHLVKLKNIAFDGFYLKSYSQEGEDMILRRIFENQKTGFYVDVGAHHPKRFSNTYHFYKKGWSGINVDAMPGSTNLFNKIRPRDINLEIAISDARETRTYYIFNEPALNGFSKELSVARNGLNNYKIILEKEIETKTLYEVLEKYLQKDQSIDFMSIDVEGMDYKVLKSNDWGKYRPKIILIEILDLDLNNTMNNKIYKYLHDLKYGFYAKTANTVIFKDLKA